MRRPLAVLTVAGALAAPAALAMTGPSILLSPNPVHRGHKVRVHGTAPGCHGSLTLLSNAFPPTQTFAGVNSVNVTVRNGTYSKKILIPAKRKPRRYDVTGRCGGGALGVRARLRVVR
jgi:hypothetical protein